MNATNGRDYSEAQERMIRHLIDTGRIQDSRVIEAMRRIPRHLFVPLNAREQAYEDHALVIGYEQTISQPFMVARMTELLELSPQDKVLEIGTGSGYQTAVMAVLACQIYTVERIPALAVAAEKMLAELQLTNIQFKVSDGTEGWAEAGPFNAIIVTASAPRIPSILVGQLAVGGRLVIPVGSGEIQRLTRVCKREYDTTMEDHGGCVFVPLIGKYGWSE